MAQLVARLTGGQEAVSSSLATRTTSRQAFSLAAIFMPFYTDFSALLHKKPSFLQKAALVDNKCGSCYNNIHIIMCFCLQRCS